MRLVQICLQLPTSVLAMLNVRICYHDAYCCYSMLCAPVWQTWRAANVHKTVKTLFRIPPTKNRTNINSKTYYNLT